MRFIGRCDKLILQFYPIGCLYVFVVTSKNIFLKPNAERQYTKTAKVFSAISIVIVLSGGTFATVFHVYPNNHFSILNGCVEIRDDAELVADRFFGLCCFVKC